MKLAWLHDGVVFRVDTSRAQCLLLKLTPGAVNTLVFVIRRIRGGRRRFANYHIETARNPHQWLKYDSGAVSALVLNAFALGKSINHTIQAHLVTPLLSALLSLGPTVDKTVDK